MVSFNINLFSIQEIKLCMYHDIECEMVMSKAPHSRNCEAS